MSDKEKAVGDDKTAPSTIEQSKAETDSAAPEEIGGPKGPDPTRFGDWSVNGRCIDF